MLAAETIKAGDANEGTRLITGHTISDWQTGLNPLAVGKVGIGDVLDGPSQQCIELRK